MQPIPQVDDIETGTLKRSPPVRGSPPGGPPGGPAGAPVAYRACGPVAALCTTALALLAGFAALRLWRESAESVHCVACSGVCDRSCSACSCLAVVPDGHGAPANDTFGGADLPYVLVPLRPDARANECSDDPSFPCGL